MSSALALTACADDDAGGEASDETGDGDGDMTGDGDGDMTGDGDGDMTGDGDGDMTGDGDGDMTGDGDGDDDKPSLGDTPNVLCEAAITHLNTIIAENDSDTPDATTVEAAYVGTGLQEFVQLAGTVTGRIEDGVLIDDAAILASIAAGQPLDLLAVEWRVYLAMQQYIRKEINGVAGTLPDPANDPALLYARWDAAYCYWDGALRPLAQIADAIGTPGDSIEADIDAAFERGHAGIEGPQPWAIDEWEVPSAKQQAEKTTYTMVHRLVMQWSADAANESDADLAKWYAHQAHGAYQLIEDRIASKNTPSIAVTEAALLGDPSAIDADQILRDMNIAFAKRTRRYTDLAVTDDLLGTSGAFASANEGATYSKLIEPFMLELDGFDMDAYRQTWATYIQAIADDDHAVAEPASVELTDWNCQFQAVLGIAECTYANDETE